MQSEPLPSSFLLDLDWQVLDEQRPDSQSESKVQDIPLPISFLLDFDWQTLDEQRPDLQSESNPQVEPLSKFFPAKTGVAWKKAIIVNTENTVASQRLALLDPFISYPRFAAEPILGNRVNAKNLSTGEAHGDRMKTAKRTGNWQKYHLKWTILGSWISPIGL